MTPDAWARRVVQLAQKYDADFITGETNQGGSLIESVIKHAAGGEYIRLQGGARHPEQARPRRTRGRHLRTGPRPPRRTIHRTRRPDVRLDTRLTQLPRPHGRPRLGHQRPRRTRPNRRLALDLKKPLPQSPFPLDRLTRVCKSINRPSCPCRRTYSKVPSPAGRGLG